MKFVDADLPILSMTVISIQITFCGFFRELTIWVVTSRLRSFVCSGIDVGN